MGVFCWNGTRQSRVWTHSRFGLALTPSSLLTAVPPPPPPSKLYNLAGCSAGTGLGTSGRLEVGGEAGQDDRSKLPEPQPVPDQLIRHQESPLVINRQIAIDLLFQGSLAVIRQEGFGVVPISVDSMMNRKSGEGGKERALLVVIYY